MSYARGGRNDDLEGQNEELLGSLHSKVKQLRAVTTDIHDDANRQNSLLDTTSQTFDSFRSGLTNSATRLARSITQNQSQSRLIGYALLAAIGLFVFWRFII